MPAIHAAVAATISESECRRVARSLSREGKMMERLGRFLINYAGESWLESVFYIAGLKSRC